MVGQINIVLCDTLTRWVLRLNQSYLNPIAAVFMVASYGIYFMLLFLTYA